MAVVSIQNLPVESKLLALVLLPNTESNSALMPRRFGAGEAVNAAEEKH